MPKNSEQGHRPKMPGLRFQHFLPKNYSKNQCFVIEMNDKASIVLRTQKLMIEMKSPRHGFILLIFQSATGYGIVHTGCPINWYSLSISIPDFSDSPMKNI